jgi:pantoate--beta-alanine ligase
MKTCTTIKGLRAEIKAHKLAGKRVGFVPTMGALHEGHLSLARTLRQYCDTRVCSIFVNPTQFNDPKDYEAYIINLDKDKELLEREGVDILFAPHVSEIYPKGYQTSVTVSEVAKPFEGALRPGHFTGVATVVTVLFNAVTPDVAIFGEKDFQQLRLIEQMVRDLHIDIEIVRGALVRDSDGLALSSRNVRLSPEGRRNSLAISRGLFGAQAAFQKGEIAALTLEGIVSESVRDVPGASIDYISVINEGTLEPVETVMGPCRILVVVKIEGVRLLDNIALVGREVPHP